VTRKITDGVARIKLGLAEKLTLGNLDAKRDWGFAGDFVEAMYAMVQKEEPGDYVICTGVQHTIRELLTHAFDTAGITDWEHYIETDPRFKRPAEVHALHGSYMKAKEKLGWEPKISFKDMIALMVNEDIKRLSNDLH
jgi:GDPmannose 4,6-dehydratase